VYEQEYVAGQLSRLFWIFLLRVVAVFRNSAACLIGYARVSAHCDCWNSTSFGPGPSTGLIGANGSIATVLEQDT
jgi:hypothetical protein